MEEQQIYEMMQDFTLEHVDFVKMINRHFLI